MIRIAIVEDEPDFQQQLQNYLIRYGTEKKCRFRISTFCDAVSFLADYRRDYDLVFMDIKMPGIHGMEAAWQLRRLDQQVALIFVTTLVQYAIAGYEVGALYYLLKPLHYHEFVLKLTSALKRISRSDVIIIRSGQKVHRIDLSDIHYLESDGHNIRYHLGDQIVARRCSLRHAESELDNRFVRCSSSFIVNLAHARAIKNDSVDIDGTLLHISRTQRQAFAHAFDQYREDLYV